jgi:hypothetical protein
MRGSRVGHSFVRREIDSGYHARRGCGLTGAEEFISRFVVEIAKNCNEGNERGLFGGSILGKAKCGKLPLPRGATRIIEIAGNLEQNIQVQQFRDKILRR